MKHTPRNHHDRENLQEGLTGIENVAHQLNEGKRRSEQKFHGQEIISKLSAKLPPDKKAYLIRQDDVKQLSEVRNSIIISSLPSQNIVTPFFAKMTFLQRRNTCHSARLLSNSRTSRPIRTPLESRVKAFRQYFCIVCIVSLPRCDVLMHSKHLNVVTQEKNVPKSCNSSNLIKRWYEFSSVR